jgi:hypothetical protein
MPPKLVKRPKFQGKYGMLTEDFFVKRTLYQRAYYPLFVFQRLLITAVLIMFYDYPLYQIYVIFSFQVSVRP